MMHVQFRTKCMILGTYYLIKGSCIIFMNFSYLPIDIIKNATILKDTPGFLKDYSKLMEVNIELIDVFCKSIISYFTIISMSLNQTGVTLLSILPVASVMILLFCYDCY